MNVKVTVVGMTFAALLGAMPAHAATDEEALKCGTAVHKFLAKLVGSVAKAPPKLCKNPGDLSEVAGKIAAKAGKAAIKLVGQFDASVCDLDVNLGDIEDIATAPPATLQTAIASLITGGTFGGSNPPDRLCNNIDD